jgi:hypothetical protein
MNPRLCAVLLAAVMLLAGAEPSAAQGRRGRASGSPGRGSHEGGRHRHFREFDSRRFIVPSRVPVFGWGFDAYHFSVTQPRGGFQQEIPLTFGFGLDAFRDVPGFIPLPVFPFPVTVPTVVIVQQLVPVQVPVPVIILQESLTRDPLEGEVPPAESSRLRLAPDSFPVESPRLPPLTLLVLPGNTVVAATAYWLEGERVIFLTSAGARGSVPFDEMDWEMTSWLNAERGLRFLPRARGSPGSLINF